MSSFSTTITTPTDNLTVVGTPVDLADRASIAPMTPVVEGGVGALASETVESDTPIERKLFEDEDYTTSIREALLERGFNFDLIPHVWQKFITDIVTRKGGIHVSGASAWSGELPGSDKGPRGDIFDKVLEMIFNCINEEIFFVYPGHEERLMRISCEQMPNYWSTISHMRSLVNTGSITEIHIGNNNSAMHIHDPNDQSKNTSVPIEYNTETAICCPIGCKNMTHEGARALVGKAFDIQYPSVVVTNAIGNATSQVVEFGTPEATLAFTNIEGDSSFVLDCKNAARMLNKAILETDESRRPRMFLLPRGAPCTNGDFTNKAWPQRINSFVSATITRDIGTGSIKEKDFRNIDAQGKPIEERIVIDTTSLMNNCSFIDAYHGGHEQFREDFWEMWC